MTYFHFNLMRGRKMYSIYIIFHFPLATRPPIQVYSELYIQMKKDFPSAYLIHRNI